MFKYKMDNNEYKEFYEIKATYEKDKLDKIKDLKKTTKHKYPNGEEYVDNWKQSDILTINKIRNIKGLCLSCKKPGMIFTDKNGKLIAKCGNSDDCGYNLEIDLDEFMQHRDVLEMFTKDIETIKEKIIIWKLNLLYKLDQEDVVLREFEQLKQELNYKTKILKEFKKNQFKKDQLTIEENGENIPISRKNLLNKLQKKIIEKKEKYKNIMKNYIDNDLNDNSVKDAMLLHKDIMEDIEKHRKIKYELGYIEIVPNYTILRNKGKVIKEFIKYEKEKDYESLEHQMKPEDE